MRAIDIATFFIVVAANLQGQTQQPAYWWSQASIIYDGFGSGSQCFSNPEWGLLMEIDGLGWFSGQADSMTPLRQYPGMDDVAIGDLRVLKNGTLAVLGFDSSRNKSAVYVFDGPHTEPRIIDTLPLYTPLDDNWMRVVEPDMIIVNRLYSLDRGVSWQPLVKPGDTISKYEFIDLVRSPFGRVYALAAIYGAQFYYQKYGWFQRDDGALEFTKCDEPPGTYDLSFLSNGRAIALTTENMKMPYVWFRESDTRYPPD